MINLTQHTATQEQVAAGVVDLCPKSRAELGALLTFNAPPSAEEMGTRAAGICRLVPYGTVSVMIGGAPFFMRTLEDALSACGYQPYYAFSVRDSVDGPDGRKTSVFRHAGFVAALAANAAGE